MKTTVKVRGHGTMTPDQERSVEVSMQKDLDAEQKREAHRKREADRIAAHQSTLARLRARSAPTTSVPRSIAQRRGQFFWTSILGVR